MLNARQIGKSSLAVRTVADLTAAGIRTIYVDLQRLGGANVTPEQWYLGLLAEIGRGLNLREEFLTYWRGRAEFSLVKRVFGALREVALGRSAAPAALAVPPPQVLAWETHQAEICENANQWSLAAAWVDRIKRLQPGDREPPQFWPDVYAEAGRWDRVLADYQRAIAVGHEQAIWRWYLVAGAQLNVGDLAGYRQTCALMLRR